MKLWSKEALVLGGIYGVLEPPLTLLNFEILSNGVFFFFIASALMLCFNKTPKFLSAIISEYPKVSYYIASFGWVPFVALVLVLFTLSGAYLLSYSQTFITSFIYSLSYICLASIIISLIIAYLKDRKNNKHKEVL